SLWTRCARRTPKAPPSSSPPTTRAWRAPSAARPTGWPAAGSRRRSRMGRLSYLFREAWRGLWHHRSLTFTAFLALVGALLVPCVFLVVFVNALSAVHQLGDRREMVVFLEDGIPDTTKQDVERRLALVARQITFVSKDEAWDEMAKELGGDELLRAVNENPLPASFRVKLRPGYLHYAAMDSISQAISQAAGVEEVQYGGQWIRRLDQFLQTL